MKIIDRHLLREFLVPLGYSFATFTMLVIVIDLFDALNRFMRFEIPAARIVMYYIYLLPTLLDLIAPVALLLATLYALATLTRTAEITAMRACGFSLYRIIAPFLGVGLVIALAAALIKETVTPRALEITSGYFTRDVGDGVGSENHDYYNSASGHIWNIGNVDSRNPSVLHRVTVRRELGEGNGTESYAASRAEFLDQSWWFHDCEVTRTSADDETVAYTARTNPYELRVLTESPAELIYDLKPSELHSSLETIRHLRTHRHLAKKEYAHQSALLHQRLALPWACFVTILFGIPAGTRTGRSGAAIGVILAFVFLLGFYTLMNVGLFLGIRGALPAWLGGWLPVVVGLIAGGVMVYRMR